MAAAATATNGQVLDNIFDVAGGKVIVQVVERNEADMASFEDERVSLQQRLLNQERSTFLGDWSSDLVAKAQKQIYLQ